jgi:hypothetical protein
MIYWIQYDAVLSVLCNVALNVTSKEVESSSFIRNKLNNSSYCDPLTIVALGDLPGFGCKYSSAPKVSATGKARKARCVFLLVLQFVFALICNDVCFVLAPLYNVRLFLPQSERNDVLQFVIVIQKPATSVVSRYVALSIKRRGLMEFRQQQRVSRLAWGAAPRAQQDEPLVCIYADKAKGASSCKVGSFVEIQTAATQKNSTS